MTSVQYEAGLPESAADPRHIAGRTWQGGFGPGAGAGAAAIFRRSLARYESTVRQLSSSRADCAEATTLQALLARDDVDRIVGAASPLSHSDFSSLAALDQRLREQAVRITSEVGEQALVRWRGTRQAPTSAWWWWLDQVAGDPKPNPWWAIGAALCLTLSLSLMGEIARRFLTVGPDILSVFSMATQGILALLAGSAVTGLGRQWLEDNLARMGIKPRFQSVGKLGAAVGLLVLVLALRLSLPAVARYYNNQSDPWALLRGTDVPVQADTGRDVAGAMERYQRAISLDPDYGVAHYNLGSAYEDILDYDKAMVEYQTALRVSPRLYAAYNNLAHLYLARRGDFGSALVLLNQVLDAPRAPTGTDEDKAWYALYKNRAWAYFGLKLLDPAQQDLRQALTMHPGGAAAYCLVAQVREVQGKPEEARSAWEDCVRFAPGESVEPNWLALAQQRVATGGT